MLLKDKNCIPCPDGAQPLTFDQCTPYFGELLEGWEVFSENKKLRRTFQLKNFVEAMNFAQIIAEMAEEQWHHPELKIGFGSLEVIIWTHKIDGLLESDFIFAAKVDSLYANFAQ